MPRIALPEGVSIHCAMDDYLWPWSECTPVLMMHGFARKALFWNRWVPAIAEKHRIYRPELLGCGLSDQPPQAYHYTTASIGAQITALLDALSLSRVHWVGESSGGLIGLLLAAAHPERVASLVLCNTPSRIPDRIRRIYALDRDDAGAAMLAHGTGGGAARRLATDWIWTTPTLRCKAGLYRKWTERLPRLRRPCAIEDVDTIDILARIDTPVLLLSGDKSQISSDQQKIFAERLPNGHLQLFAGYGHGVNLLLPERCAQAALAFWDSLASAGNAQCRPGDITRLLRGEIQDSICYLARLTDPTHWD